MTNNEITSIVNNFKSELNPDGRYSSFDYCYSYFKNTQDLTQDMEKSCLVLGFYLASWGMLRGSSFLLQKSAKHYEPTIRYIATLDKSVWKIDVDTYTDEHIETILKIYQKINGTLIDEGNSHLTLVTKILLGVFGFIPAFDQYFCSTFRKHFTQEKCGFRVVNKKSLNCIKAFYKENKIEIDSLASSTFTIDFKSGKQTNINYPKAKIIDMYGFTAGFKE
jgi:hypothetical protein